MFEAATVAGDWHTAAMTPYPLWQSCLQLLTRRLAHRCGPVGAGFLNDLRPTSVGMRALFHHGHTMPGGVAMMRRSVAVLREVVVEVVCKAQGAVPRIATLLVFLIGEVDLEVCTSPASAAMTLAWHAPGDACPCGRGVRVRVRVINRIS